MSKQKTWTAKAADLKSEWFVVDATDQVLGRLASGVAAILRGKHKPTYTPHLNSGDHVVVINAAKVKVTGSKLQHGHQAQKPKTLTFDAKGNMKIG